MNTIFLNNNYKYNRKKNTVKKELRLLDWHVLADNAGSGFIQKGFLWNDIDTIEQNYIYPGNNNKTYEQASQVI